MSAAAPSGKEAAKEKEKEKEKERQALDEGDIELLSKYVRAGLWAACEPRERASHRPRIA